MPDLAVVTASCRAKEALHGGRGTRATYFLLTVYNIVSRSVCFILSQSRQHINVLALLHCDGATSIMLSTATACPARSRMTTCVGVKLTGLTYHGCRRTVYKAKFVSVMIAPFSLL